MPLASRRDIRCICQWCEELITTTSDATEHELIVIGHPESLQ